MVRTLGKLDEIPRYLFRVFTEKSCETTDKTWAKSEDARDAAQDYNVDLFSRDDNRQVADMISRHLWWDEGSDSLVSWTSSLLFALVYVLHRRTNRVRLIFDNIYLCVIDTTCFSTGVFIRDMDLIQACGPCDPDLGRLENLRKTKYYFGEYLSQGALQIEGECEIISAQAIINEGLYVLLPELESFAQWEPQPKPPWPNEVIKPREKFYYKGETELQGSSEGELQAAIHIGELFGQRWRMPMAINFIALIPRPSDDTNILLTFRSTTFTGTITIVYRNQYRIAVGILIKAPQGSG